MTRAQETMTWSQVSGNSFLGQEKRYFEQKCVMIQFIGRHNSHHVIIKVLLFFAGIFCILYNPDKVDTCARALLGAVMQ